MEQLKLIRESPYLGEGGYGRAYHYEDYAVKVYHEKIKDEGALYPNPCRYRRRYLQRLKERCKNIEGISHIQDLICEKEKVLAVLYDYQEGDILTHQIDHISFEEKMNISNSLIDTSKSLARHRIYPMDYKSRNTIYNGETCTIIDLDDVHTKMRYLYHPLLQLFSISSLKHLIFDIFSGDQYKYSFLTLEQLASHQETKSLTDSIFCSYHTLHQFLKKREQEKNLLFVNHCLLDYKQFSKIRELTQVCDIKVILFLEYQSLHDYQDRSGNLGAVIQKFQQNGIPVYDVYIRNEGQNLSDKMKQCIYNYQTNQVFMEGFFDLHLEEEIEYYANACKQKIR